MHEKKIEIPSDIEETEDAEISIAEEPNKVSFLDNLVKVIFNPKKPLFKSFSFEGPFLASQKKVEKLIMRELLFTDIDIEDAINNLSVFIIDFLQDWDELEIDVPNNKNLKKTVLKNIINSEEKFREGIDSEVLKLLPEIQKKLESIIEQSYFFRATDINVLLNNILDEDKRWKSQFETGDSNGCLNPFFRSFAEKIMFGLPRIYRKKEKRPIYGFFTPDKNGILNSSGSHPERNSTSQYGRVHCRVKKEVALARATLTFQDSLSSFRKSIYPSFVAKPSMFSINHISQIFSSPEIAKEFINKDKMDTASFYDFIPDSYTEVQYHDGLSLADIESIHVSPDHGISEEEIKNLREAIEKHNEEDPDQAIEFIVY